MNFSYIRKINYFPKKFISKNFKFYYGRISDDMAIQYYYGYISIWYIYTKKTK